jgi:hypothetical protein
MGTSSFDLSTLREWLSEANYAPILEAAENRKGILSQLTALSYEEDAKISERAIEATGLAARVIARHNPEYVRNYLLRLFCQFFPMLISLLDLDEEDAPRFQVGTLWAIGRVAQATKDAMLPALPKVRALISEGKPIGKDVKEKALWCIQQLTAGVT